MRLRSIRPQSSVCQLCDFLSPRFSATTLSLRRYSHQLLEFQKPGGHKSRKLRSANAIVHESQAPDPVQRVAAKTPSDPLSQAQINEQLQEVRHVRDSILSRSTIPPEQEVRNFFSSCEAAADILIAPYDTRSGRENRSAASALLRIEQPIEQPAKAKTVPDVQTLSPAVQRAAADLSEIAFSILAHPPVFITPETLKRYVNLQALLRKPETFPEVFNLFAEKPVPKEGSSPIKYYEPNPHKVANAVDKNVADRALDSAIQCKQLVTAMDIVDTTYNTKAFHRAKFFRRGLLPLSGLAVAPIAVYTVASQLSSYQTTMDPAMATNLAFVGILAYVGFTTTVGVVAITTANDQMDRITWATGMPLRERWIREEERAAIDRIAGAWGFREPWRRGEEEGEDWDLLREWVGRRGMVLDRVELMEGME